MKSRKRLIVALTVLTVLTVVLFLFSKKTNLYATMHIKLNQATVQEHAATGHNPGIPKIIHQVWDSNIVPNEFVQNVKGLVKLNPPPEWQYYYWPLPIGKQLIERKYPALLKLYDASHNLMKADILRLVVIHQFGGVYFDLDTVGVKPLKPFVENSTCSVVTVPPEIIINKDMIVRVDLLNNAALFCRPGHPYFSAIIQLLEKQSVKCQAAIQCAGPFFISHVYNEMRKDSKNNDILPRIENYQLYLDKIPTGAKNNPLAICTGKKYDNAEVWRREMCDEWIRRGKSERGISAMAYTYHTWFHVLTNKVTIDRTNAIHEVVPHAIVYK